MLLSASSNHFCSNGFNLHMFLKLRFRASNRLIVVCEKSLPYSFPIANPTSPWVKPSLMRRCLKVLANCSSSSRSVVSSGEGSITLGALCFGIWGVCTFELGVDGVNIPPTLILAAFGGVVWVVEPNVLGVEISPGEPFGLCSGELMASTWFFVCWAWWCCCCCCCCFWSAMNCCWAWCGGGRNSQVIRSRFIQLLLSLT